MNVTRPTRSTTTNVLESAWKALKASILYYQGRPVGTIAARDPSIATVNYDQCFVRDFIPSALYYSCRC